MSNLISRTMIFGDTHLCSKDYGAHNDYPKESLYYFKCLTEIAEQYKPTHIVGLGDLSFGRFHTLEFRRAVEVELTKQNEICNGNRIEIKGNHDSATYGMTEYEYYLESGLIKKSRNLSFGNINISMVDNGKLAETELLPAEKDKVNIIVAHDFFKFSDSLIANYGKAIILDNYEKFFGYDYIICGHIHKYMTFKGSIIKGNEAHNTVLTYLGCMSRPSFIKGAEMDDKGHVIMLEVYDDGQTNYKEIEVDLWSIPESFNLAMKEEEQNKKELKESRVDISDIVKGLNTHERDVGDPESIIENLQGVDEKYKKKAIKLLKDSMS